VAENHPEHLVALMIVKDGHLAVFANTRLTDESAAVMGAERQADAGEIFDVWWEDDQTS
jgi:hypothetical protein